MDTLFPCIKQSLTLVSLSICNFLCSGQPWNQDNCHLNRGVPSLVVTDPVEPSFSKHSQVQNIIVSSLEESLQQK